MKRFFRWSYQPSINSLQTSSQPSQLTGTKFSRVWHAFQNWLIESSEPRVWQTYDRSGKTSWNAYDPTTGRTVLELSEAEMRAWIEQRHYRTA